MDNINIVNARLDHSEIIWQWRNDLHTQKMFFEGRRISISEHKNWYKNALLDDKVVIYVGEANQYPVGVIRFDQNNSKQYDVSINVNPDKRGLGIGKVLLVKGIKKLKDLKSDSKIIFASVKNINAYSHSLFQSCGFKKIFENDQITKYKFEFN